MAAIAIVPLAAGAQPAARTPNHDVVRIVSQQARWTGLSGPDALGDDSERWYVISGEIENDFPRPVAFVKLVYELLDTGGRVVASEYGFNHRAEDLRRPDYEAGQIDRRALGLEPLAPGARDSFRMLFIRSEVPRFDHSRVRVVEVAE